MSFYSSAISIIDIGASISDHLEMMIQNLHHCKQQKHKIVYKKPCVWDISHTICRKYSYNVINDIS